MSSIEKNNLIESVKSFLHEYRIQKGAAVLVGLSGGPDSTALLFCLNALSGEMNFNLTAAYFNHHLRPESELTEETAVIEDLCSRISVSLVIGSAEPGEIAGISTNIKRSIEDTARELRFKFLFSTAESRKCDYIALGHTKNDQIETVIMRFFQGSHVYGLSGIPAVRDKIIRPCIKCPREMIISYLDENHIPFSIDSTNETDEYLRNRLRRSLIPSVSSIFPGFATAIENFQEKMEMTGNFIEKNVEKEHLWEEADKGFSISVNRFNEADPVVQLFTLYRLCDKLRDDNFRRRIPYNFLKSAIIASAEGKEKFCQRGYGLSISQGNGRLFLQRDVVSIKKKRYFITVEIGKYYQIDDKRAFALKKVPASTDNIGIPWLREEAIQEPLILRSRREGDCINLKSGKKQVKNILNEMGVPRDLRWKIPIIEDTKGIAGLLGETFGYKNLFRKDVQQGKAEKVLTINWYSE